MYRTLDDFLDHYAYLNDGTGKLLDLLTDEVLGQQVVPGHRNLGQLAWHLVTTVPEMMQRTGLPLAAIDPHAMPPASAAEIANGYGAVTSEFTQALKNHWADADLAVTDDMYGENWPRGLTLTALIQHEIHHRGQMTVLMRQAGLQIPGLYGPALEEWQMMGMEVPAY
jgi:uncharacterized damage-inducible protein DinB